MLDATAERFAYPCLMAGCGLQAHTSRRISWHKAGMEGLLANSSSLLRRHRRGCRLRARHVATMSAGVFLPVRLQAKEAR